MSITHDKDEAYS